jgi:molybdate transport system permease protein
MDWYPPPPPPPYGTRCGIAAISTAVIYFLGLFAAYYIAKLPRLVKGVLDVVLTLPLVLPPTVVGYLLLRLLGPRRPVGAWFLSAFRHQARHDLVVCHFCHVRRDLSPHVPNGARRV